MFSKYFLILALIVPVTLLTPYGIDYWVYIFKAATLPRDFITEWMPFNIFHSTFFEGIGFKLMLLATLAGYGYKAYKKDKSLDMVEVIALLATLYLGIKHQRHTVFFCIVAGSFVYRHFAALINATVAKIEDKLARMFDTDTAEKLYFGRECLFYAFLMLTSLYVITSGHLHINMSKYPVKAVEFIRINRLSGNLFVPFNWGSYCLWRLYPQNLVSFDGRFEEAYEIRSFFDEHNIETMNKDGLETFNRYHHDVFLTYTKTKLYNTLKSLSGWHLVYETDRAAVFVPAALRRTGWLNPPDVPEYYVKTKYQNKLIMNETFGSVLRHSK